MNTVQPNVEVKTKKPKLKTMVFIYLYIILIMFILSVAATYTWFSLTRTPRISDMTVSVSTRQGLELSLDMSEDSWGNSLSFLDMVGEHRPLRPITWSNNDKIFYAATYNINGRLTDKWLPLSDDRNANSNNFDGYYIVGTFYARSSQTVSVSLTPAMELQEGIMGSGTYVIGKPIWNSETISHDNAGKGAENAVRLGIKVTLLDETGAPLPETEVFYIYEPNCDTHSDGRVGYIETPSIDLQNSLVPSDRLIKQTSSKWTETDPVQNGVLIHTFGDFEDEIELFTLKKGQRAEIKLYIWLEGQDVDCTNEIGAAQIFANIQFKTDPKGQTGFDPIDPIE